MIPFEMVRKRVVYSACLTMFFLFANNLVTSYYLAIYFQGVRGKSPTMSGVYMLPGILGQIISGIVSGYAGVYARYSIILEVANVIKSPGLATICPGPLLVQS